MSRIRSAVLLLGALFLALPAAAGAQGPGGDAAPAAVSLDQPLPAASQPPAPTAPAHGSGVVLRLPFDAHQLAEEKAQTNRPAPAAAKLPLPASGAPQAPGTSFSFAGLNRNSAQSGGFIFNPPDTIVGRSPNTSLEGTNSALRLFNATSGVLATATLNTFFGAATTNGFLFDPKVFYDRLSFTPRYVVTALQEKGDNDTDPTNNLSRIWIAISRAPDPTSLASTGWCRYSFDARRGVGTSNESWADYDQLGVGADALLVSVNQFRFTNDTFTFAIVHAIRKAVYDNASACPSLERFVFQPAGFSISDGTAFSLQPAQSYTSPSSFTGATNPAYLVSTPGGGSTSTYYVWRVRNLASSSPTISSISTRAAVPSGFPYAAPPDALQPGTSVKLDTGDTRTLQVAARGNNLNHVNSDVCQFTAGTAVESCWMHTRTTVGQDASSGNVSATLKEQRLTGFGDNTFAWMPGVTYNANGQTVVPVQFSNSSNFLSGAWEFKALNADYSAAQTFAGGTCALTITPQPTRTGDYTGAQVEPTGSTDSFVAAERATTLFALSGCNWSTQIARVHP